MNTRAVLIGAMALSAALIAPLGTTAARAEVVYGNMGPQGTDEISDQGADFGPSAGTLKILAQGFTTGSDPEFLTLQSVRLGAFAETAASRTVSIYTNIGGNIPGAVVATSSPTTVQAKNAYDFSFGAVKLAASTSYWIVPQFDVDWFWYQMEDEGISRPPTVQNGSGYSFLGSKRSNGTIAGTWANTNQGFAVSVSAVPEPSAVVLALSALGLCSVAAVRRGRRRSKFC